MAFQGLNIARLRQAVLEIRESVVGDISLTMPITTGFYPTKVPGSKMNSKNLTAIEVFSIPEITMSVLRFLDPEGLVNIEQVARVFRCCKYLNYTWLELCKAKWYVNVKILRL